MIYHANTNWKKAGVAVLMSDKAYSTENNITRDNECNFIMIKMAIKWKKTWKKKKNPTTKTTQNALKYKAKTLYY